MSTKDPKRTGSRDISELKARLGLKKGTGAQPAGGKPNGAGVVPPPGLNLPPPPGAKPPGPVIPSASDDPFGAMNAMAQIGASQRAPEIVIVNDGKPVESVSSGERAAKIGKYAAIAIVPLILGLIIGQIAKDAKFYNSGLSAVQGIKADVDRVRKGLGDMKKAFDESGLKDLKASRELTKVLSDNKDKLANKKIEVFKVKQNQLNADLSAQILIFYSKVTEIEDLIIDHVSTASMEEAAIKVSGEQLAKFGVKEGDVLQQVAIPYRIGLFLNNPADEGGGPQAARLVEIGAPLCGGDLGTAKISDSGKCAEDQPPVGFLYRFDPTIAWSKGKVHIPGSLDSGSKFPLGELILLQSSGALDSLVKTSAATMAEESYFKRLRKIYEKVGDAFEYAEALKDQLEKKSQGKPRFTFFM